MLIRCAKYELAFWSKIFLQTSLKQSFADGPQGPNVSTLDSKFIATI